MTAIVVRGRWREGATEARCDRGLLRCGNDPGTDAGPGLVYAA